jgi:hypothetical protein
MPSLPARWTLSCRARCVSLKGKGPCPILCSPPPSSPLRGLRRAHRTLTRVKCPSLWAYRPPRSPSSPASPPCACTEIQRACAIARAHKRDKVSEKVRETNCMRRRGVRTDMLSEAHLRRTREYTHTVSTHRCIHDAHRAPVHASHLPPLSRARTCACVCTHPLMRLSVSVCAQLLDLEHDDWVVAAVHAVRH